MKIRNLALLALTAAAVTAFGCSGSTSGAGGSAGAGGAGGAGGADPGLACVEADLSCRNSEIDPTEQSCELEGPPEDPNGCAGDESLEAPGACATTNQILTVELTQLEILGDCNDGYELDGCDGDSCRPGGATPGEGMDGVDNGLAGLGAVLGGVEGNLGTLNQAFHDGICEGDIAIGFLIDLNGTEDCATLTVIDDGEATEIMVTMNFDAESGCLSGTIGRIPLDIAGVPGSMNNAVLQATISDTGLSNGRLGATVDEETAKTIADQLLENGASVIDQALDINDDLSGGVNLPCDALSMTLTVGGPGESSGAGGTGGAGGAAGTGGSAGTGGAG